MGKKFFEWNPNKNGEQELDENAKASDYQDQLALLQERLVDLYPCSTQAFTWKADFVPDWHILGVSGANWMHPQPLPDRTRRAPAIARGRSQYHQPSVPAKTCTAG